MIERRDEISEANAEVVLVAYDRPSTLAAKLMAGLDMSFVLLLDPQKESYRRWGLGRTTITRSVLSPTLTWRYVKLLLKGERFLGFAPDMLQLGADFVIDPAGRIAFAHLMRDNGDRAPVTVLLEALRRARDTGIGRSSSSTPA